MMPVDLRAEYGKAHTPVDVLRLAKELIAQPDDWCQVDAIQFVDGNRYRRCAAMAINSLHCSPSSRAAWDIFYQVNCYPQYASIGAWNDDPVRTHAEIMIAFNRAISAAEKGVD
jgi:hypothetical protein